MDEAEGIEENVKETFNVGGTADNVLQANAEAWAALESKLGRDPASAWSLARITHTIDKGELSYSAEFRRNPFVEVPPLTDAEVAKRREEAEHTFNNTEAQQ